MRTIVLLSLCFCIFFDTQAKSFTGETDTLFIFESINDEVVIAAENYSFTGGIGGIYGSWYKSTTRSGYLDEGYVQSTTDKPGDNSHLSFNTSSANLNYVINFKDTGTFYVHLRTFAPDHTCNGFFATLNGEEIYYGGANPTDPSKVAYYIFVDFVNKWWWHTDGGGAETRGLEPCFHIPDTGQYTFAIYRRDVGSIIDHIWLTKNCSTAQKTNYLNIPDDSVFIVYKEDRTDINIDLAQNINLNVFPNPVQSILTIDYEQQDNTGLQIEILTITGNTVFKNGQVSFPPLKIDLSKYDPGMYILKLTGKENCILKKFIKN